MSSIARLSWEGGRWTRARRRSVRPTVSAAMDLALESLAELGVELPAEVRTSVVRATNNSDVYGSAHGGQRLNLYFTCREIKSRRISEQMTELFLTAGHELAHVGRNVAFPGREDLVEYIASEGVSYTTEALIGGMLLHDGEFNDISEAADQLRPKMSQIRQALQATYDRFPGPVTDDQYKLWMISDNPQEVPLGVAYGVASAVNLLEEGASLPDLISLQAEELLGVA